MRPLFLILIACISAVASAAAPPSADERQIIALEEAWISALVTEDRAALNRIVASDFVFIEPDGSLLERDVYLKNRAKNPAEIHSFEGSEMAVKIFGNAALVTGLATIDESLDGKRYIYKLRWKEMWVKNGGSWQVVAGQATPVNVNWNTPFAQR